MSSSEGDSLSELEKWMSMVNNFVPVGVPKVNVISAPEEVYEPLTPSEPKEKRDYGTIEITKSDFSCSWIGDDIEPTEESLLKALFVTEKEREYIWSVDQREKAWHLARRGRMTGSRVGTAANHCIPYSTPDKLVHEWLYVPIEDNDNMKWGRDHEDEARNTYKMIREQQHGRQKQVVEFEPPPSYLPEEYRTITDPNYSTPVDPNKVSDKPYSMNIVLRGLIVHPVHHWMGYSPDGEVYETDDEGLLEIKCPRRIYPTIPWYYYDQIQFGMFNLNKKWTDFFVWTKYKQTLVRYQFNPEYWNKCLYPLIHEFYMKKFLPAAVIAIKKERNPEEREERVTKCLHL